MKVNKKIFYIIFCFWYLIKKIYAHSINNRILNEPTVKCNVNSLTINFQTEKNFGGRAFVKGYSHDRNCYIMGDNQYSSMQFTINFDQCGIDRVRELNGLSILTTIVISFHSTLITKVDRAYRVNCFYTEQKRFVSQNLSVDLLTTQIINKAVTTLPVCKHEILTNKTQGVPIKYAKIGDLVYHKWSCESQSVQNYCMRIHDCSVNDGQGGEPYLILDQKGCEANVDILQNLEYLDDLTAGQYAYVFKFADKFTINFNCQIEFILKDPNSNYNECKQMQPKCSLSYPQYYSQTETLNSLYDSSNNTSASVQPLKILQYKKKISENLYSDSVENINANDANEYLEKKTSIYSDKDQNSETTDFPSKNSMLFQLNKASYYFNSTTKTFFSTTPSTANLYNAPTKFASNNQDYDRQKQQQQVKPDLRESEDDISLIKNNFKTTKIKQQVTLTPNTELQSNNFEKPLSNTNNYEDVTNSNIQSGTQPSNLKKNYLWKRLAKQNYNYIPKTIVGDLNLPEKTLVVIDIDESPLAQDLLREKEKNLNVMRNVKTFKLDQDIGDNSCISYSFFTTFSLLIALFSIISSVFLTVQLKNNLFFEKLKVNSKRF